MKTRTILLATSAVLVAAFSLQAMPLSTLKTEGKPAGFTQVDLHWSGENEHREHHDGHRREKWEHRSEAFNAGKRHDDDDDDDDDDDWGRGGNRTSMQPQNVNPPSNGLFTPGSKPRVQMN